MLAQIPSIPIDEIERLYTVGGLALILFIGVIAVLLALIFVVWRRQPPTQVDIPGRLIDLLAATTDHTEKNADAIGKLTVELGKQRELSEEAWKRSEEAWKRIKDYDAGHQRDMMSINDAQKEVASQLANISGAVAQTAAAHEVSVKARHDATLASIEAVKTAILAMLNPIAAQISGISSKVAEIEPAVNREARAQLDAVRLSLARLTEHISDRVNKLEEVVTARMADATPTETVTETTTIASVTTETTAPAIPAHQEATP